MVRSNARERMLGREREDFANGDGFNCIFLFRVFRVRILPFVLSIGWLAIGKLSFTMADGGKVWTRKNAEHTEKFAVDDIIGTNAKPSKCNGTA